MQTVAHSLSRRLLKPLAVTLALFSILFLAQLVPHAHANNHEAAACRICQVGHIGISPAVSAVTLSVPLVTFGHVPVCCAAILLEAFSEHSSPRAPPAATVI